VGIAVCGTTLFTCIAGQMISFPPLGFYRSTDDGASWACVLPRGTFNTIVRTISSGDDTILLAGTGNGELFDDISGEGSVMSMSGRSLFSMTKRDTLPYSPVQTTASFSRQMTARIGFLQATD
jgi:hypothetical protein